MLPIILGGMAIFGTGYVAKKVYEENKYEIDAKIEDGLEAIQEWFEAKTEALENYSFSTRDEEDKYQVEEEINLDNLQHMKKKVYHDSFVDFISLYEKIENVNLGKLEYQEMDFNSKIYGEDSGIATLEEFTAKVKAEIEENFGFSSNYKFALDGRDALLKAVSIELPEAFLKRWIKATNEKMTDEQIDGDFDNFMTDLKWQLIKDRIVRDNDLKITEEDVRALAKEMAAMQFRQYGLNNVGDEHLENYANHMLKNEEERRKLVARKQEDVIVSTIKDKVTLDVKEVSFDEFNKMLEN